MSLELLEPRMTLRYDLKKKKLLVGQILHNMLLYSTHTSARTHTQTLTPTPRDMHTLTNTQIQRQWKIAARKWSWANLISGTK